MEILGEMIDRDGERIKTMRANNKSFQVNVKTSTNKRKKKKTKQKLAQLQFYLKIRELKMTINTSPFTSLALPFSLKQEAQ